MADLADTKGGCEGGDGGSDGGSNFSEGSACGCLK